MKVQPLHSRLFVIPHTCADPEGGGGTGDPDPPWKITKIKDSLAILVQIPLKSQSYQCSIQCWAIKNGVDGPLKVVFGSFLPHQTKKKQQKNKTNKNVVNVGHPLTKNSGSVHDTNSVKLDKRKIRDQLR